MSGNKRRQGWFLFVFDCFGGKSKENDKMLEGHNQIIKKEYYDKKKATLFFISAYQELTYL